MNRIKTVLAFEYFSVLKNKAFIITNLILALIIIVAAFVPGLLSSFNSDRSSTDSSIDSSTDSSIDTKYAAYIDMTGQYDETLLSSYFPQYEWVRHDLSQFEDLLVDVENSNFDLALNFRDSVSYDLIVRNSINSAGPRAFNDMVTDIYQRNFLSEHGVSDEIIQNLLNVELSQSTITVGGGGFWLGYVILMITFFPLILYGSSISMSVVAEKTSKTVELIFTSASPKTIIFGKVFGVGLVMLTQLAAMIMISVLALFLSGSELINMLSPTMLLALSDPLLYVYIFIFFILAFFSFSFLFAACASTAKDAQDVSSVNTIPVLLSLASFYIGLFSLQSEFGTTFINITSFIPFLSPTIMIVRICTTIVPAYQILIAIFVNFSTVMFAGIISSRIYSTYIMMHGKKVSFKSLISHALKG